MLGSRPLCRSLQLLYSLRAYRALDLRLQALTMADKMSTYSPRDAKVTSIEPMVSFYSKTCAVVQAHG
jgi:hypothetical protein